MWYNHQFAVNSTKLCQTMKDNGLLGGVLWREEIRFMFTGNF
ncbi:protein of unknown function [Limnospira indica PCC 8005]|uniref:Uncharacterized protein n=1 Tax=Limnospira indica PCC 8005 TaxID=376219 RepID=A0A9P1P1V1_9CYAN|nr:protein of unknown function [Limnospira indica PCC 8005]